MSSWESWLEPLQGFGDQKRTDVPSTLCVHQCAGGSSALRMVGGSCSCPSSVLEYLWVSLDLAASSCVGQGVKGAVGAVHSAGTGCGFISCRRRIPGVGSQAGDMVCFSISSSDLLSWL